MICMLYMHACMVGGQLGLLYTHVPSQISYIVVDIKPHAHIIVMMNISSGVVVLFLFAVMNNCHCQFDLSDQLGDNPTPSPQQLQCIINAARAQISDIFRHCGALDFQNPDVRQ